MKVWSLFQKGENEYFRFPLHNILHISLMQLLIILHPRSGFSIKNSTFRNINKDVLRKPMKDQMKVVTKHSAFT